MWPIVQRALLTTTTMSKVKKTFNKLLLTALFLFKRILELEKLAKA